MEFIEWHYTAGLRFYIHRWLLALRSIEHYFSLPLLLRTLFSPWKRLTAEDSSTGFNLQRYFENLTFNFISRGIGAIARLSLFFIGCSVLFFVFVGGAMGIIVWLLAPPIGLVPYEAFRRMPQIYVDRILYDIREGRKKMFEAIFGGDAGDFFIKHLGVDKLKFKENTKLNESVLSNFTNGTYKDLIAKLIDEHVWSEEFLRRLNLTNEDLVLTARWWDEKRFQESYLDGNEGLGRPGLGLDLVFGYIPNLSQYSADLSAPRSFSHRLIGREDVVSRMERALSSGVSVVLVGPPGVGKKTVVLEFADKAITGQLGPKMIYNRVMEFDYNFLLAEASDVNLKKAKLSQIFSEASAAGNVILVIKDIQRLTNTDVEGYDFTDIFEAHLERKHIKMILIANPADYERFIYPNARLRKYLETIDVHPPSKELAMQILIEVAKKLERSTKLVITTAAIRKILDDSDRYITETPYPEKALELLDAIATYKEARGGGDVTIEDVNVVMAEKTGISFSKLTEFEKNRLTNLESIIHERMVNQDAAISLIAKSLRARSVGVSKENKPIGSFLFMGPTGVGKTETAKVLAKVYYGSETEILRFDMAEYGGVEGLERLIGSVSRNQPGVLTTAIKNKPASLLLLDEIEKATPEIFNLFLTLLDEGMLTDAFGRKINCRNLFVIATSNAGAEYVRGLVSNNIKGSELQTEVINHILQKRLFSPEFINRFDGVVVYEPLSPDHLVKIAHLMLNDLATNLKKKDVHLEITDEVAHKLSKDGYDPAFGARPMRRIIDLNLGDLLGSALLSGKINDGDKIRIIARDAPNEYSWEKVG